MAKGDRVTVRLLDGREFSLVARRVGGALLVWGEESLGRPGGAIRVQELRKGQSTEPLRTLLVPSNQVAAILRDNVADDGKLPTRRPRKVEG